MAEMFAKDEFNPLKFYGLCVLLIIVIWSRINIGCHTIIESCFAAVIGLALGFGYYNIIKNIYSDNKEPDNNDNNDNNNNNDNNDNEDNSFLGL